MTPVTICFVIPQNEHKTFKQKSFKHGSSDDFTVTGQHFTLMLTGKLLTVNSAYLSTSRDAIWTNRVKVFCAEV